MAFTILGILFIVISLLLPIIPMFYLPEHLPLPNFFFVMLILYGLFVQLLWFGRLPRQ